MMQEAGENGKLADAAIFVSPDETTADPFAVDFFAQDSAPEDEDFVTAENVETIAVEIQPIKAETKSWYAELPKISRAELKSSGTIFNLSPKITENALRISAEIVSQCILNDAAQARCEFISSEEVDLSAQTAALENERAVFINFAAEPKNSAAVIAFDSGLASSIVRSAFGGGAVVEREMSQTEIAVIEFFALCFFGDINKFLNEPLFRLQTIEQNAPAWLGKNSTFGTAENFAEDFSPAASANRTRGLSVKARIQLPETAGIVELLLPFEFLADLSETRNPLLSKPNGDLSELKKIISGAKLRVYLGETRIEAADLLTLENGDVVVIESPAIKFRLAELSGAAQIRIADEARGSLFGELKTEAEKLQFTVSEIAVKNRLSEPTRLKMDENQSNENAEASGLALEKVTVTVAVEIASRRLNLEELAGIRVGQIIELGTRATDSVELVADGKTLAVGELIDIEGSLGVRLTRVLL